MAIKVGGTTVIDDSRVIGNLGAALAVNQGGSGATDAATARTNLGARALVDPVSVINTNTTAVAGTTYVLIASLVLTLPISPTAGQWVMVTNRSGTITASIARNGQPIMGLPEDLIIDSTNAGFKLEYTDATRGWVIF